MRVSASFNKCAASRVCWPKSPAGKRFGVSHLPSGAVATEGVHRTWLPSNFACAGSTSDRIHSAIGFGTSCFTSVATKSRHCLRAACRLAVASAAFRERRVVHAASAPSIRLRKSAVRDCSLPCWGT